MRASLLLQVMGIALLVARPATGQALRGKVLVEGVGPVPNVEVRLISDSAGWHLGVKATSVTDAAGDFLLVAPTAGTYVLDVRRFGIKPARSTAFRLSKGDTAELLVRTERNVAQLSGVDIKADSGASMDFTRGFAGRRAKLKGHFLDRADIEKRGAISAFDVVAGLQGLRIVDGVAGSNGDQHVVADRGGRSIQGGGLQCFVATFVDGIEYDQVELGRTLRAADFEAVEFYTPAETPNEFRKTNSSCGTLLFWTRVSSVTKKKG